MQQLNWDKVEQILRGALAEDLGGGDVTCDAAAIDEATARARIISKAAGVLAGGAIAARVFTCHDPELQVRTLIEDGCPISPGMQVLQIEGSGRSILEAERTALNFLCRCSGIATRTARFVQEVRGYRAKILDTRKTAPLLRELDKYAVRAGGGENHRHGLFDMILVKENHIRLAGGIVPVLEKIQQFQQTSKRAIAVEIEVETLDELQRVLRHDVDRVLLDNFTLPEIRQAVELAAGRVALEVSGGVTLDNVRAIAATGVDYISIGALTHSVQNLDMSLLIA